jgi:hypothetical protein
MEKKFNIFSMFDKIIDIIKKPFFNSLVFLIYLSYFLIFFGIVYINKKYIQLFSDTLLIFVCLFLIIRFHPYRKHELRNFDAKIIFASAILLLTNTGLTKYYIYKIKNNIESNIKKINNNINNKINNNS